MSEIDWNDPNLSDEAVVRAAVVATGRLAVWYVAEDPTHYYGGVSFSTGREMIRLGADWKSARNHEIVVAFEQANRPTERKDEGEEKVDGDGFSHWILLESDKYDVANLPSAEAIMWARKAWIARGRSMKA